MIQFIERGDIFNIPGVNNYAHGCNCAGAMGKGIALQFKSLFKTSSKFLKNMITNELKKMEDTL